MTLAEQIFFHNSKVYILKFGLAIDGLDRMAMAVTWSSNALQLISVKPRHGVCVCVCACI